MVLNSEKKDKFDESGGKCLILSSLISPFQCHFNAVLYQPGFLCRFTDPCSIQNSQNFQHAKDHAKDDVRHMGSLMSIDAAGNVYI